LRHGIEESFWRLSLISSVVIYEDQLLLRCSAQGANLDS
jgi:hypothetical protein